MHLPIRASSPIVPLSAGGTTFGRQKSQTKAISVTSLHPTAFLPIARVPGAPDRSPLDEKDGTAKSGESPTGFPATGHIAAPLRAHIANR